MIEEAIECYKSAIQATSSTSTLDFTNHVTFDSEQYNAKTVLLNNLAASFAIQTDYEKARKQLQHITELIPSDLISQKESLEILPLIGQILILYSSLKSYSNIKRQFYWLFIFC